jgi:uncharacterized repeat protein (TIGR03803 family)
LLSVSFSQASRLTGFIALIFATGFAHAQQPLTTASAKIPKETILYNFTGGADGANPNAGVIFDRDGALYGTTVYGGTFGSSAGSGTVFKLTAKGHEWTRTVLHSFSSPPGGINPFAGVIFGSDGALYGTTVFGGNSGYGTVYKLTRPTYGGTLWNETILYTFTGGTDGANPSNGSLIADSNGTLYGTTINGGGSGNGTVYKLTPPTGGGTQWSFTVLYTFPRVTSSNGEADGAHPPAAPLVFDNRGALYGTTRAGGSCQNCGGGYGTVYKLTPPASGAPPGTPWVETVLYYFMGGADGYSPDGGVILGGDGALYGTTSQGGAGWGSIYKLTPPASGTIWTKIVLHNFSMAPDGNVPYSGVIFDRHSTMYGTTADGGAAPPQYNGTVFQVQ